MKKRPVEEKGACPLSPIPLFALTFARSSAIKENGGLNVTPERILRIRRALGYTQEKLAQLIGVTWTTVHRWEAGSSSPTGMGLRSLLLLERAIVQPGFQSILRDPRANDPMFVMYSVLSRVYGSRPGSRHVAFPKRGEP